MQGVPQIPLDIALWVSLAAFVLGVFFCIPIWFRNWQVRRGVDWPITEELLQTQALARWLALFGVTGAIGTGLTAVSRVLSFGAFMAFITVWCVAGFLIALRIDAARARRH